MKRLPAAIIGGSLVLALTGCGVASETADQVGNAATTVGVCSDAVRIATATPDLGDPQAALDHAHAAGRELTDLAARAGNTTAGEAIDSLATTLRETTVDDVVTGPADWVQRKTDQVTALTKACGL
ncbi:bacteriophage spanin2 family protein [Amycolatopsis sp. NPDC051371]|uniref:bacteriophage spanin2 family protein n=1 Tax=Amycolatopsis sp. NPDC051371 TaxID=3155800 RepID=UPI0034460731